MKRLNLLLISMVLFLSPIFVTLLALQPVSAITAANWIPGSIIDDDIFTDKNSMSVAAVQAFLNSKVGTGGYGRIAGQCDTNGLGTSEYGGGTRAQYGAAHGNPAPFTCLKDYYEVPKTVPGPGIPASNYGGAPIPAGAKSAAQLIWDAAQTYNINPQVLLVTIQKESYGPLTTDDWPFKRQFTYAMGAHCPDGPNGADCDPNYAGFSMQIRESAKLFRYYLDGMDQPWWGCTEGGKKVQCPSNRAGGADPGGSYKVPYTTNFILWNVRSTGCGGGNIYIENKATAALYYYTPYQPNHAALNNLYGTGDGCSAYGNRNFWRIFNDWFGSTISALHYACKNASNISGVGAGRTVITNKNAGVDRLGIAALNSTSSKCIEAHSWANGNYNTWSRNIATNHPAVNPVDNVVISADTNGDGYDERHLIKYRGGASGKIEIHSWDDTNQHWSRNIATNHPAVNPVDNNVIAADVNGDGKDEFVFVKYRNNGSGKIEIHTWAPNQQGWVSNIATNHPAFPL